MVDRTIILKVSNKTSGSYNYIEFNTLTRTYVAGDSASHLGHDPNYLVIVEVKDVKELLNKKKVLESQGYIEVETFCPIRKGEFVYDSL